jgi:hypothetical protein
MGQRAVLKRIGMIQGANVPMLSQKVSVNQDNTGVGAGAWRRAGRRPDFRKNGARRLPRAPKCGSDMLQSGMLSGRAPVLLCEILIDATKNSICV